MKLNLENLSQETICGSVPPIAINISTANIYGKDGKPTGETDGFRLGIVTPGKDFGSLSVKLTDDGLDLCGMTNEDISAANAAGRFVFVGFKDFSAKAYVGRDGKLAATATASKVFLVDATGKAKAATTSVVIGGAANA